MSGEQDLRAATTDMEDTALWDVRRIALLAARRDGATPVRYYEEAVTESMRSLHRLTQEALWDELQKHDLGKRTLRALAAEYKPVRMVAFEPDDLRKASVRFWESLRLEDEVVREALAAYDYSAVSEQLSKLSGVLAREVVARLVYINCPRVNVVEEVVGTIVRCTTNELKMLASRLYDRLDKTGSLSAENREIAGKLQQCKTKEELRARVRDLLSMFKRKPPPGETNPNSDIIGPSVATVTVSYKGKQRQVAAVVRIERLDTVVPDVEAPPPPPPPARSEPVVTSIWPPGSKAGIGSNSVVTVGSDRTIPPPSPLASKRPSGPEALLSRDTSQAPSGVVAAAISPKAATTPAGSALVGPRSDILSGTRAALSSAAMSSVRPGPPGSVVGVAGPGSDLGGSAASSVKGLPQTPKQATPSGSVIYGHPGPAGSDVGGRSSRTSSVVAQTTKQATPRGSAFGLPSAPGSDLGSVRRSTTHVTAPQPVMEPGSDVGSARSGPSSRTTPAASGVGVGVRAGAGPASLKSVYSSKSSQSTLQASEADEKPRSGLGLASSQHGNGSISFDHSAGGIPSAQLRLSAPAAPEAPDRWFIPPVDEASEANELGADDERSSSVSSSANQSPRAPPRPASVASSGRRSFAPMPPRAGPVASFPRP